MSDDVKNSGYDDSFWADVDALRAMLEEENTNESAPVAAPKVQSRSNTAEKQMNLNFQNRSDSASDFEAFDFSGVSQSAPRTKSSKKQKKNRSRRRSSKGLIITLYVIIALELTALCGVAASWYLWIQ